MTTPRPFKLFNRPKIGAERYPWDEQPPVPMDDPFKVTPIGSSREEWDNAPRPPDEIGVGDPIPIKPRTALDRYRETVAKAPELKKATGWKGVLQTIGDMFINPEIMHPNYSRQMRDYERNVGLAKQDAEIELRDAEERRKADVARAQMESDYANANKAQADIDWKQAQANYEKKRTDELGKFKPTASVTPGTYVRQEDGTYKQIGSPAGDKTLTPTELEMLAAKGDKDAQKAIDERHKRDMQLRSISSASDRSGTMTPAQAAAKKIALEQNKAASLRRAEADFAKATQQIESDVLLSGAGKNENLWRQKATLKAQALDNLTKAKQQIEDTYTNGMREVVAASGGDPSSIQGHEYPAAPPPPPGWSTQGTSTSVPNPGAGKENPGAAAPGAPNRGVGKRSPQDPLGLF